MESTRADWFSRSRQFINSLSGGFEIVGIIAMGGMALLTLVDVIGSKAFLWPVPGSTELISRLQIIAIAGGLAFSKIDGRHIAITMLVDWLKGRGKAVIEVIIAILGLGLFAAAGWMCYQLGLDLVGKGTETMILAIPYYPFAFWIAVCCIPMCCAFVIDLVNALVRVLK